MIAGPRKGASLRVRLVRRRRPTDFLRYAAAVATRRAASRRVVARAYLPVPVCPPDFPKYMCVCVQFVAWRTLATKFGLFPFDALPRSQLLVDPPFCVFLIFRGRVSLRSETQARCKKNFLIIHEYTSERSILVIISF